MSFQLQNLDSKTPKKSKKITIKEMEKRNRSNRMIYSQKIHRSDIFSENQLMAFVITNSKGISILKNYPYLFAVEYMVHPPYSQFGKGDLIFTNGKNHFLVVELKYLTKNSGKTAQTSRRKHRRKVEEQAFRYGICFKRRNPEYTIAALAITNENMNHKYYANILF